MDCLDANVVQDLMAGALDEVARASAVEHLDGCGDCRDLIGALAREATRDAAVDTLRDSEKRAPGIALMETMASGGGDVALLETAASGGGNLALLETAAVGGPADEDALGATAAPGDAIGTPVRIRAQSQPAGRTLGRYTLIERLGAGAMGVVYRAEDRELGRDVALKQLHRPDADLTDRLVREARSMAQVNHPNVVAVYDVGVADGTTYIAMELVTGQSLRGWQDKRSVPELVEAYIAAGRGLAAAHDAGIVHRDFKPDNVLVGKDGRVRVTDFGLAASRPGEGKGKGKPSIADVNLTTSGSVLGTPAYMAPEQFTGGNVDARTDQFNFCVALHEALYGFRPFVGKTFDELGDNVCEGRVRPAPAGSRVSTALRRILLRGLAVKPGDRYPTMANLLEDLGRDRAKPWRRTSYAAAALAAALALGLVSDWAIRDRVLSEISQSFAATTKQTDRAVTLLASRFDAISNQAYGLTVMRDVTGHHDKADFGLGTPEDDAADLEEIHQKLASADWKYAREVAGKENPATIAIADYKGRLLYTSSAPEKPWKTDLIKLPWIKKAFDAGAGNSMTLMRYDDPDLVATNIFGPKPPAGLAVLFTRTLSLGDTARSQFLQIVSARQLLDGIRLDETMLSLVALDGTPDGDVPREVVAAAERGEELDGWQAKSLVLPNPLVERGEPIGRLVMARKLDSVLALFPNARLVFASTMLAAMALALLTAMRARRITQGRV